jgi:hypothetical protein
MWIQWQCLLKWWQQGSSKGEGGHCYPGSGSDGGGNRHEKLPEEFQKVAAEQIMGSGDGGWGGGQGGGGCKDETWQKWRRKVGRKGGREGETETERDRQRETETGSNRQTDRQTEKERA